MKNRRLVERNRKQRKKTIILAAQKCKINLNLPCRIVSLFSIFSTFSATIWITFTWTLFSFSLPFSFLTFSSRLFSTSSHFSTRYSCVVILDIFKTSLSSFSSVCIVIRSFRSVKWRASPGFMECLLMSSDMVSSFLLVFCRYLDWVFLMVEDRCREFLGRFELVLPMDVVDWP